MFHVKHSYRERGKNVTRQVYADANGKVFETVGENIRKGARAGELLNYKEILEKIDALDPKISALQIETVATKLNELMTALRKTKIVR